MGLQSVSRHAAAWRFDGLPLLLLVSALLHLGLIGFSSPGRAPGARVSAEDGAPGPRLRASVSGAVALAPLARERSRRVSAPASVLEPAPPVFAPAPSAEAPAEPGPAPAVERQPGPAFYEANELTIKPVALGEPALDADGAVSGEIVLALWIDAQGTVVEVSVERSDLSADHLPTVADAFRSLRFLPGEVNGQQVGAVLRIRVSYDEERLPVAP